MTAHQTIESQASTPADTSRAMTGAEILVRGLVDQGVEVLFGYPGGAVLPIYDALFHEPRLQHILVRHEQGATHAAEGYARSSGKPGVVLVTSGPGATNAITGIMDALMDSIPHGRHHRPGPHAPDRHRRLPGGRYGRHDPLVHQAQLPGQRRPRPAADHPRGLQDRHHRPSRPGADRHPQGRPVRQGRILRPDGSQLDPRLRPATKGDQNRIAEAAKLIANARRPIFYTGGGVINAGPKASALLREFQALTGAPVTSTLMGLGAFPAADPAWLGMLGMHGTFEANNAMHDCDVMICVGARFDDRVTGRLDAFSPGSKKIHIDIDASSINKNVRVDLPIIGDAASVLEDLIAAWKAAGHQANKAALTDWWAQIDAWRARQCLNYRRSETVIKPQYAIERLYELTKGRDSYITTEVGQHQMWAAQFYRFEEPNRWMTSGGLGTMGYGLPAAIGVQMAHPGSLVIDIAGEASIQMCIQEMSTAIQFDLPVKIFILNNEWMGMVRQWQQLLHGERYSHSYSDSLPDFVKLAEAYGAVGIRCERPRRAGRQDPGDDQQRQGRGLRLPRREARELPADDPLGQGPQRDDHGRRRGHRECDR
jgi:acetolactate synthase-1/2/3 large subunit